MVEPKHAHPAAEPNATAGPGPARVETGSTADAFEHIEAHLERLNRLATMGAVTGMIAHEFNNILTPILSYAQMALDDPQNAPLSTKALERTVAGAERAARIAEAILNFVREQAETPSGSCDVAWVVSEALACLARKSTDEGGRVAVSVPTGARAAIDGVRLQQVLVNLLLNARAAMGDRERDISIDAELLTGPPQTPSHAVDSRSCSAWNAGAHGSGGGAMVVIRVRDRGPGMNREQLDQLFTPFRSGSDPRFHRGTGLGMTVSRRLLADVGGWLVVESTIGIGTNAWIVVPKG